MIEQRTSALPERDAPFSLAATCGPITWGKNRWPNVSWQDDALTWVGWEAGRAVWRRVSVVGGQALKVEGTARHTADGAWLRRTLGVTSIAPPFGDPVLDELRLRFPGLGLFAAGSLYDGVVQSIIGQSISVAAAASTERRFAELFNPPTSIRNRDHWPLPTAVQLAAADPEQVRQSGVTWRRAHALIEVAKAFAAGEFSTTIDDPGVIDRIRARLLRISTIGPWTVDSSLLWGVGWPDAYPINDVALLRAARQVYRQPAMTMQELDRRAENWRPHRGWAARLLWTALLGPATASGAGANRRLGGSRDISQKSMSIREGTLS